MRASTRRDDREPRRRRGDDGLAPRRHCARVALGALVATLLPLAVAAATDPPWQWSLPRGFLPPPVPADNPMSAAKVALGRRLFFDARLSGSGTMSCATCHAPRLAYTDGRRVSVGSRGDALARNAMSLVNVGYSPALGWDGQDATLERQMHRPLFGTSPVELGVAGEEEAVMRRLLADEVVSAAFRAAFPGSTDEFGLDQAIDAIAAFERTLIGGRSAFDRYVFAGEHAALSASAKRGMAIFYGQRGACAACHGGLFFNGAWIDEARPQAAATLASNGTRGAPVRVPTLRNVALTAPYMHDGRYDDLGAVLDHYVRERALSLDAAGRADLIAFLESLTDEVMP
jgi:cytochrome c peroxidase